MIEEKTTEKVRSTGLLLSWLGRLRRKSKQVYPTAQELMQKGGVIEIPRSWLAVALRISIWPLVGLLFLGGVAILFGLFAAYWIINENYVVAALLGLVVLTFLLIGVVSTLYLVVNFFNEYKLVVGGKLILGKRYMLDLSAKRLFVDYSGLLVTETTGAVTEKKSGRLRPGKGTFRLYYNLPGEGRVSDLSDVKNVDPQAQGPRELILGVGDLGIKTITSPEILEDVEDPERWKNLIMDLASACRDATKAQK